MASSGDVVMALAVELMRNILSVALETLRRPIGGTWAIICGFHTECELCVYT